MYSSIRSALIFVLPIQDNYARNDPTCVQKVKELYKELDLETVFHEYEEESYHRLVQLINTASTTLPKGMFLEFADRIYKRKR